jgi:DNA-binding transcriptional MerR regulator
VATSALRYYDRIGRVTAECLGQRRHHPPSSAERVALIRLYQDTGFTLAEIGRLVPATSRDVGPGIGWPSATLRNSTLRIAAAQQAKTLIEHALKRPRRDRLTCSNFRCALEARLGHRGSARRSSATPGQQRLRAPLLRRSDRPRD